MMPFNESSIYGNITMLRRDTRDTAGPRSHDANTTFSSHWALLLMLGLCRVAVGVDSPSPSPGQPCWMRMSTHSWLPARWAVGHWRLTTSIATPHVHAILKQRKTLIMREHWWMKGASKSEFLPRWGGLRDDHVSHGAGQVQGVPSVSVPVRLVDLFFGAVGPAGEPPASGRPPPRPRRSCCPSGTSDWGSPTRNSFCSYFARIQRSFSSLRIRTQTEPNFLFF